MAQTNKCYPPHKGSRLEQDVWDKAAKVRGRDSSIWRRDAYGSLLRRDLRLHPKLCKGSLHAWHIDHVLACKLGGANGGGNLQRDCSAA